MLFKLIQSAFIALVLVCCGCQEREAGTSSDLYGGQNSNNGKPTIRYYLMILVKTYYVYNYQRLIPARCYAARTSPDAEGR